MERRIEASILARIFPEKNNTCPLRYGEFTHRAFHSEILELGSPEVQSWHSHPLKNDAGHLLKLQRSACQVMQAKIPVEIIVQGIDSQP